MYTNIYTLRKVIKNKTTITREQIINIINIIQNEKESFIRLIGLCCGLIQPCSSDNNNDNKGGNTVVTGEKIIGFTDNKGNVLSDFKYDKQGRLVSVTLETNSDEGKKKTLLPISILKI